MAKNKKPAKKIVFVKKAAVKPSVPAKKAAVKPSVPAKKTAAKPSVPAKKAAAKPSAPVKKVAAKPSVPAKKAAAKPSVPAKKTSAKPSVPAKKASAKPSIPAKKAAVKPSVPAKKAAVKPSVPAKKVAAKPSVPAKKAAVKSPVPAQKEEIAVPRDVRSSNETLKMCSRYAYSLRELQILLDLVGPQVFKRYNPEEISVEPVRHDKITVLLTLPKAKKSDKAVGPASVKDLFGGFDPFSATAAEDEMKMIPKKWIHLYEELLKLRDENQKMLDDYNAKLNVRESKEETGDFAALGDHTADTHTEAFDRDVAIVRIESVKRILSEIYAAIERMRNGKYGIDEVTGKPISMERLKKVPYARRGAAEQRKVEKEEAQMARRKVSETTITDIMDDGDRPTQRDDDDDSNAPSSDKLDSSDIDNL
ncbi:MAG: hypothetical protein K6B46_03370 [Opitutales bacterium]|nr:hypothetical protein [Opitutales bacterium]